MNFMKNLPPKVSTLSAVAVGYILLDDSTYVEQNALGNWLMLVAQILCTNAYFKQLQQQNVTTNNSNQDNSENTIKMLKKMIDALNREVESLKKDI